MESMVIGKASFEIADTETKSMIAQTSSQESLLLREQAKSARILDACRWKDSETLRALAVSESGLISDQIRRQACTCSIPNIWSHF